MTVLHCKKVPPYLCHAKEVLLTLCLLYPQSLNTVCGTACRLSQCLAQSCGDDAGPGLVREVAEAWEGVARAMGVASAAVKNQMLVLVQEAQSSRQDPTASQADRRADLQRVSANWCHSLPLLNTGFLLSIERKTLYSLC